MVKSHGSADQMAFRFALEKAAEVGVELPALCCWCCGGGGIGHHDGHIDGASKARPQEALADGPPPEPEPCHPSPAPTADAKAEIFLGLEPGGTAVIPAFAVGRAQALLHVIAEMVEDGDLPPVPLYLNSPTQVGDQAVARWVSSGHGSRYAYLTYLRPVSPTGTRLGASIDHLGYDARAFETLAGTCPATVTAPGSAAFTVPSFGWAVCRVSETAR